MRLLIRIAALMIGISSSGALAQGSYPVKPIRIVIGTPAGGGSDLMARTLGQQFTQAWGQQTIVEPRPGASGNIAAELVAKAAPDGYTLYVPYGTHTVNPSIYAKVGYDPIRDFAPISLVSSAPNILIVHPSLPVKSVKDLVALGKAKPGALSFGSGGNGSTAHLSGELFRMLANVNMVHVPFKGAPGSVLAVMSGEVQLAFPNLPPALPQVRAGKLRALAVTTSKRFGAVPQIPTVAEAGVPGYEARAWFGVLAPGGTPRPIVTRLNTEIVKIVRSAEMRERLLADGTEAIGSTPEEFTAVMKTDIAKWAKVIKASGAKPD